MIQVTMSTDKNSRSPIKEIGQYRYLDLAKEAAHKAIVQHFGPDADLNITVTQDSDYDDCYDWFAYDNANRRQEAVCIAINSLPLKSSGKPSVKPVYNHEPVPSYAFNGEGELAYDYETNDSLNAANDA